MTWPIDPPMVLAPMAGITNRAFRRLCRTSAQAVTGSAAGLYVSEMVTSRALLERNDETMDLVTFAPDESPRSVQLYGVDPVVIFRPKNDPGVSGLGAFGHECERG